MPPRANNKKAENVTIPKLPNLQDLGQKQLQAIIENAINSGVLDENFQPIASPTTADQQQQNLTFINQQNQNVQNQTSLHSSSTATNSTNQIQGQNVTNGPSGLNHSGRNSLSWSNVNNVQQQQSSDGTAVTVSLTTAANHMNQESPINGPYQLQQNSHSAASSAAVTPRTGSITYGNNSIINNLPPLNSITNNGEILQLPLELRVDEVRNEHILGDHGKFEVPQDCDRVQYLAEGGYGIVAKCRVRGQRYFGYEEVAVKKVVLQATMQKFEDEWEDNIRLLREIHFLKHLPHPNITPILDTYFNRECAEKGMTELKCFYLVMPLYTPGSLDTMGVVQEEDIFCGILRDITSGILWMHRHKVVHRDIKRENIFYDETNRNAVIADLGMARTKKKRMTGGRECSTKSYLAPEMILEAEYDFKCDMWALGCVCYEMLIFADEGGSMFSESNPYHLTLARQYAVNKTIFGKEALGKKKAPKFGTHNILSLAQKEIGWVKRRWTNLEKQMAHFCHRATVFDGNEEEDHDEEDNGKQGTKESDGNHDTVNTNQSKVQDNKDASDSNVNNTTDEKNGPRDSSTDHSNIKIDTSSKGGN